MNGTPILVSSAGKSRLGCTLGKSGVKLATAEGGTAGFGCAAPQKNANRTWNLVALSGGPGFGDLKRWDEGR